MRLNAIRQIGYLAPGKGSITSTCCHHLNTISQSPSRAVLSGSFFDGVQFPSCKGCFSSEPFGLLLDSLRDSCVRGWGPTFSTASHAFKSLGASRFQVLLTLNEVFLKPTLLFNHILRNHSSIDCLISPCLLMRWEMRSKPRTMQGQSLLEKFRSTPIVFHLQDWDTGEVSFWFHSHLLLSSSSIFTEAIGLVILCSLDICSV